MSSIGGVDRPGRWDVPFDENMSEEDVRQILSVSPFSDIDAAKFPKSMPLDGILLNDTRINRYQAGDIVVREGDYGNSAFFVLKGKVAVLIGADEETEQALTGGEEPQPRSWIQAFSQLWTNPSIPEFRESVRFNSGDQSNSGLRGDGEEARLFLQDVPGVLERNKHVEIGQGEFFGEIAALGRTPRTATIFAPEDGVELLEIKWQGLRDIRLYTPQIREHIDRLYRERSLKAHLRETPMFSHLDDDILEEIANATQFASFGSFDWHSSYKKLTERNAENRLNDEPIIVEEGEYANSLILIRAGFARLSERSGSGHRTIAYFGKGQYYGFREIVYNSQNDPAVPYEFTLRGIGHVDCLIVPSQIIEKLVVPTLPTQAMPWPESLESVGAKFRGGGKEKLKARDKESRVSTDILEFLVENRYINGTATMMINLERCTRCDDCVRACAAAHDNNPKFIRQGKQEGQLMIGHACMQCRDPICMIGCPTGAIRREKLKGQIVIADLVCIGCATCAESCPYDNIQMIEARNSAGDFIQDKSTNRPIVKATKCDLCVEQLGGPACERACPHDALIRMDMQDQPKLVAWLKR